VEDSVNVYIALGPKATRLLRLSQDDIEKGTLSEPIECTFPAPKAKKSKRKGDPEPTGGEEDGKGKASMSKKGRAKPVKKVKKPVDEEKDIAPASGSDEEDDFIDDDESDHDLDGIESSSDREGAWEVAAPEGRKKTK
jgi:hypothetical protein